MRVRDITEQDIPLMIDYWFNPDHQRFHEKRSAFGPAQKAFLQNQEDAYRKQIITPPLERRSTTVILEHDSGPVGQVHLNDIHNDTARRIHFHPWFSALPSKSFGQVLTFWREAGPLVMDYFFSTYQLNEIIGDVPVNNKIANFCLKKMGYTPCEIVYTSYLADEGFYNRYKFYPLG